jgi:hypothetical protein
LCLGVASIFKSIQPESFTLSPTWHFFAMSNSKDEQVVRLLRHLGALGGQFCIHVRWRPPAEWNHGNAPAEAQRDCLVLDNH